ncbi:MAG: hydrogenase nickel insertion protein HypA [Thermoprotei archaeon]|nr:MAG: hydrogenase nickel insertion protein HypA [Thermoprotei archaeon]RLF20611.1 MAG: hydrogenase nickel insertion protein HypA [Thermoprotei archaeon]
MVHEWALAESIVKTVLDIAKERKIKSVLSVEIAIGQLQQIELDILKDALNELKRGTLLEKAKFIFVEEEAEFQCRNCNNIWKFSDVKKDLKADEAEAIHFIPELAHVFIKCPRCGSPDFIVLKGRGIRISAIRGVTNGSPSFDNS